MLLGARMAMMGGGVTNPYVTDGLVAMWDGIWNAGWGSHNASASSWKELISSQNCTVIGSLVWNSNSLKCNGSSYLTFRADNIDSLFASLDNDFTIQITAIADYEAKTSGIGGVFMIKAVSEATRAWMLQFPYTTKLTYTYRPHSKLYSAETVSTTGLNSESIVYDHTQANSKIYKNQSNYSAIANGTDVTPDNLITIGSAIHGNFVGDIYAVRIYNRALSADEIAANYAIDQARFGLT